MPSLPRLRVPVPALALALLTTACAPSTPAPVAPVAAAPRAAAPASATAPASAPVRPPEAIAAKQSPEATRAFDRMGEAVKAAKAGDADRAVALFDQAAQADPANRLTLWTLALVAQREAARLARAKSAPLFLKSADLIRKFRAASKDLSDPERQMLSRILFNEGCTYALEGRSKLALAALDQAADTGLVTREMLDADKELSSLHDLPEFAKLKTKAAERSLALAVPRARTMLAQNKPFPFSFALPSLDGKTLALADFKGKVTIVDLWGSWCAPCRQEAPHLVALYDKYHEKGLEIIGINYEQVNDDEVKETIRSYVAKAKIPYPCVLGDAATQEQIPGFRGFPTTLFVDRAGVVRVKLEEFDPSLAADLEAIVTLLLDEPRPKR